MNFLKKINYLTFGHQNLSVIRRGFILSVSICIFHGNAFSQRIIRSTLGTLGSSDVKNEIRIQQSIGQPSLISHENNGNGYGLRQGFIQPSWYEIYSNELHIQLYPNPNNGVFYFQADLENDEDFEYEVIDQQGKIIFQSEGLGNELINVTIENPARGMYHLNVRNREKISSFKINVIY